MPNCALESCLCVEHDTQWSWRLGLILEYFLRITSSLKPLWSIYGFKYLTILHFPTSAKCTEISSIYCLKGTYSVYYWHCNADLIRQRNKCIVLPACIETYWKKMCLLSSMTPAKTDLVKIKLQIILSCKIHKKDRKRKKDVFIKYHIILAGFHIQRAFLPMQQS